MKNYKIWILFLLINITAFTSDQYIYSQILKDNLIKSDQYKVEGFNLENDDSVQAVGIGGISLKEFLESSSSYDETVFEKKEVERYEYNGDPKSMVKFTLVKNTGVPLDAKFSLTLIDEDADPQIYRRLIDEKYTIPAPTTNFTEKDLEPSKNTFTYDEDYQLENLIAYKHQEVVFRLYKSATSTELIPLKKIEDDTNFENFMNDTSYVDFVFENNGTEQIIEKNGIIGKFIDGKFELLGLNNGEIYNLDFYTLRYRGDKRTGNYVVVTYEDRLGFQGKNNGSIQGDIAWLDDIDVSGYKEIALNIISVTNDDISGIDLKFIKETREGTTNQVSDIAITTPTSLSGTTINIGGISYEVIDNQIIVGYTGYDVINDKVTVDGTEYNVIDNKVTIDGVVYDVVNNKIQIPEKKYVYKWTGKYDTAFVEEESKERKIQFSIEGNNIAVADVSGIYIEPAQLEKDIRYPHQRVFFDASYPLEDQKYNMIDRILIPARLGYRQIKSIDYATDLNNYLHGDTYTDNEDFIFENNRWKYATSESVNGLVVEKTVSEAKANFTGENGDEIEFYTDDIGSGLNKLDERGDKVIYDD
jgi:hypothetical protein